MARLAPRGFSGTDLDRAHSISMTSLSATCRRRHHVGAFRQKTPHAHFWTDLPTLYLFPANILRKSSHLPGIVNVHVHTSITATMVTTPLYTNVICPAIAGSHYTDHLLREDCARTSVSLWHSVRAVDLLDTTSSSCNWWLRPTFCACGLNLDDLPYMVAFIQYSYNVK